MHGRGWTKFYLQLNIAVTKDAFDDCDLLLFLNLIFRVALTAHYPFEVCCTTILLPFILFCPCGMGLEYSQRLPLLVS